MCLVRFSEQRLFPNITLTNRFINRDGVFIAQYATNFYRPRGNIGEVEV